MFVSNHSRTTYTYQARRKSVMTIAFRDFEFFYGRVRTMDATLSRANEWVQEAGVDVINVETLMSKDKHLEKGLRVWYREPVAAV